MRKGKVRNATAKAMKAHLRRKKEAPLAAGAGDETPLCEATASPEPVPDAPEAPEAAHDGPIFRA